MVLERHARERNGLAAAGLSGPGPVPPCTNAPRLHCRAEEFTGGAADGFNLIPPVLPAMLDSFADQVVPILPKRGLLRIAYEGATLRERYGLVRPANRFFGGTSAHTLAAE
jgi:hypothetical protein